MMPLALADVGTENLILKVGGSPEVKKHLEDLGFVAGGTATVVASMRVTVRGYELSLRKADTEMIEVE